MFLFLLKRHSWYYKTWILGGILERYGNYFESLCATKLQFEYMLNGAPPPQFTHINYALNFFYINLFGLKQVTYNTPESQQQVGRWKRETEWGRGFLEFFYHNVHQQFPSVAQLLRLQSVHSVLLNTKGQPLTKSRCDHTGIRRG